MFIKIDVGIHLGEDGVNIKVHREAAEQIPAPGLFILKLEFSGMASQTRPWPVTASVGDFASGAGRTGSRLEPFGLPAFVHTARS